MTAEENQRSFRENETDHKFPVGMRVLAVDDDPTCLKLLENLLRRCQYHVTTTGQAITALKLLRENREKFDLVISDVHMPDMDGFRLLELVGLEMDLPVIMLSANSDTRAVMKGITHGACDYLLKPVRIEELKNIWQHVVRRRKVDSKDHNHNGHGDDNEMLHHGMDGGHGSVTIGAMDQKLNRKRKDQDEDDEDDPEENGHEHEDPSAQKKPRVVWSVELHQKFVAAVNQLGIDKAVPKRILDLMNVDRLTRENVASHLQKYRLYLKRISCVANQQGNIAAALGGIESSFVQMGSLDGFGDFHALSSGQLQNTTLSSFPLGAVGRLNSPAAMGLRGISPSGMSQLGQVHSSGNSISYLGKFHRFAIPGEQHGNLLHGLPTSLELDQLQQKQSVSYLGEFSGSVDDSSMFPISQNRLTGVGGLNSTVLSTGCSNSPFLSAPNNPLVQVMQQQQAQCRGLGSQSPVTIAALDPDLFDVNAEISSHLPEYDRGNTTWQNAVPLTGYSGKALPVGVPLSRDDMSSTNLPYNISANTLITAPSHDPLIGGDSNHQGASLVDANTRRAPRVIDDNSKFSISGYLGNGVGHSINYGQKQDYTQESNLFLGSPLTCAVVNHGITSPVSQNPGQNPMKLREEYLLGHAKSQGGFSPNSCNSFDDLMNTVIKRERDEATVMDGDIGCDVYPIGTCI